jgi:hypothetical protein
MEAVDIEHAGRSEAGRASAGAGIDDIEHTAIGYVGYAPSYRLASAVCARADL